MKTILFCCFIWLAADAQTQVYASIDGGIAFHTFNGNPKAIYNSNGDQTSFQYTIANAKALGLHIGYAWKNMFIPENDEKKWHDAVLIEYDQRFYLDHRNPAHFGFRGGYEVSYKDWQFAVLPGGYYRLMNVDIAQENYWIGGLGLRIAFKHIEVECNKTEFWQIKIGAIGFFKKE